MDTEQVQHCNDEIVFRPNTKLNRNDAVALSLAPPLFATNDNLSSNMNGSLRKPVSFPGY